MEIRKLLLIGFVFSGIAALVYEITWIRPLQFLLGSTTYTISIIFAAFMAGLALGSLIISKHVDRIKNPPKTYALLEIGIGLYGLLLLSIFNVLPKVYNLLYSLHANFYFFQFVQFALVFAILLVPTMLMGATFPLVAKYYTREKIGKGIGEVYFANNLGAIIGSFTAGFILIPLIGIKFSIIFAAALNLVIAIIILLKADKNSSKKILPIAIILFLVLALAGDYNIQQMHSGGFYRTAEIQKTLGPVVYYEEGVYATITVRELFGKGYALFINGKGQGGYEIGDLRVNFLLAYLPLLVKQDVSNALVIGLGTGTTSGQLSQFSRVTSVEIEPKILRATSYFNQFNLDVLNNPNHTIVINDARNYLFNGEEKYEVIIQEPSDPWQSFSTALYSKEFLEVVKEDLSGDGIYVHWVPIYTMSSQDFENFYKTFNSVFNYTIAFANIKPDENTPVKFETSEIILLGSVRKIELNEEDMETNYNLLPEKSKQQLSFLRLSSGKEVYHLLMFTNEQFGRFSNDSRIITDDNALLEFSTAKRVLNQNTKEVIKGIENFLKNE